MFAAMLVLQFGYVTTIHGFKLGTKGVDPVQIPRRTLADKTGPTRSFEIKHCLPA